MERSGYSEDCDEEWNNSAALYRQALKRAVQGKRGQAFLRELATALDAMPAKELITEDIVREDGHACAIGAVALARKLDVSSIDPTDSDEVAKVFGVAPCLAREIAFQNDDDFEYLAPDETPAQRWTRMRKWVDEQIRAEQMTIGGAT